LASAPVTEPTVAARYSGSLAYLSPARNVSRSLRGSPPGFVFVHTRRNPMFPAGFASTSHTSVNPPWRATRPFSSSAAVFSTVFAFHDFATSSVTGDGQSGPVPPIRPPLVAAFVPSSHGCVPRSADELLAVSVPVAVLEHAPSNAQPNRTPNV